MLPLELGKCSSDRFLSNPGDHVVLLQYSTVLDWIGLAIIPYHCVLYYTIYYILLYYTRYTILSVILDMVYSWPAGTGQCKEHTYVPVE